MTKLTCILGDITTQTVDAIVNAANPELSGGGGVDGAIHAAAGPELLAATQPLAPCPTGEARITPGFQLPARWVIHTVGPIYCVAADRAATLLAQCYQNCLDLAVQHQVTTIAFPSISTGTYGYPIELAAPVATQTVRDWVACHPSALAEVHFILHSEEDLLVYRQHLRVA